MSSPVLITRVVTFDPEEMARRGRLGAAARHARHDPRPYTAAARAGFLRKLEQAIDPDNALPPEERQRRVVDAQHAHMRRMARISAEARQRRARGAREDAGVQR